MDNVIEVRQDVGGNIEVLIDSVVVLDAPAAVLQSVTINGGVGGDSFVVTTPLSLPEVILNGEAGSHTCIRPLARKQQLQVAAARG